MNDKNKKRDDMNMGDMNQDDENRKGGQSSDDRSDKNMDMNKDEKEEWGGKKSY